MEETPENHPPEANPAPHPTAEPSNPTHSANSPANRATSLATGATSPAPGAKSPATRRDSRAVSADPGATSADSPTTRANSPAAPVASSAIRPESRATPADPDATAADSSAGHADSSATGADSSAASVDSSAAPAESPAVRPESRAVRADSRAVSAGSPASRADPPTTPANSSADSANSSADSANSSADSADSPADSANSPTTRAVPLTFPTTDVPANPTFAAQPVNTNPGLPWGFLAFFTGFGAYYLVSLIITGAIATTAINPDAVQPNLQGPIVLLAILPNLLLGLAPAVLSRWRGNGPRRDFGIRFTKADVSTGLTCGIAALGIGLVVNFVLQALVFHNRANQSAAEELGQLAGGRSVWLAIALLFVAFVAPLTEEMLLRGALWGALEHYRVPRLVILALTALVFAFLHQEPTLTLALFGQGLALGTARMRTGRIGASMIAHATNNVLPALVLWFVSKP
jgi:membrane protease YdiL (CAAX protease family)